MDGTTIVVALLGFAGVFATAYFSQRGSKEAAEAAKSAASADAKAEENAHDLAVAKQQTEGWQVVNAELRTELDRVNALLTTEREAREADRQEHMATLAALSKQNEDLHRQVMRRQ